MVGEGGARTPTRPNGKVGAVERDANRGGDSWVRTHRRGNQETVEARSDRVGGEGVGGNVEVSVGVMGNLAETKPV